MSKHAPRIGIYAGAFDPVHAGHIAFALQAIQRGKLDQVVFLPERRPRTKPGVEHYAHRIAMLKAALAPHPQLAVMEMVDKQFTVPRTLPQLRRVFRGAQLVFLMGSDTALTLPAWPYADALLASSEIIVGVRSEHQQEIVTDAVGLWRVPDGVVTIIESFAPDISSSKVRRALQRNDYTRGVLESVRSYARREWLYISLAKSIA